MNQSGIRMIAKNLALYLAGLAQAVAPGVTKIKDNVNHELSLGRCPSEAHITLTIRDKSDEDGPPYLFPQLNPGDKVSSLEMFSGSEDSYQPVEYSKDGDDYPAFPGHFQIPAYRIRKIQLVSQGKRGEYKFYLIPPEVAKSDKHPNTKDFGIEVDFKCNNTIPTDVPKTYAFLVSNKAQLASPFALVSALAASLIPFI